MKCVWPQLEKGRWQGKLERHMQQVTNCSFSCSKHLPGHLGYGKHPLAQFLPQKLPPQALKKCPLYLKVSTYLR